MWLTLVLTVWLGTAAHAPITPAEPVAAKPTDEAAAPPIASPLYLQAWGRLPPALMEMKRAACVSEFLDSPDGPLFIEEISWAAAASESGFVADWSFGLEVVQPHNRPANVAGTVLLADADRCLQRGDASAAAARICTVLQMARHLAEVGTLTSTIQAGFFAESAAGAVLRITETYQVDPPAKARLLDALNAFRGDDAFSCRQSLINLVELTIIASLETAPTTRDDPETAKEIVRLRDWLEDVLAAWDKPDGAERLVAIGDRVSRGEYGLLSPMAQGYGLGRAAPTRLRTDHIQWSASIDAAKAAINPTP